RAGRAPDAPPLRRDRAGLGPAARERPRADLALPLGDAEGARLELRGALRPARRRSDRARAARARPGEARRDMARAAPPDLRPPAVPVLLQPAAQVRDEPADPRP